MRYLLLLLTTLSLTTHLQAIEEQIKDPKLYKQVLSYNPQLVNSYYYDPIPLEEFVEFLNIYENRPIETNICGMRSEGNFFLWHLLRKIKPSLVIESGVWKGQSTWTIEQAVPEAEIICMDPDLTNRIYISQDAFYTTTDFSEYEFDLPEGKPVVAFFDDHINAYDRVLQCSVKGIKHIIFDDNYAPGFDDCVPGHLTLRDCFEMGEHRGKAAVLKHIIKRYAITPQIVGRMVKYFPNSKADSNQPALWKTLNEIDPSIRNRMKVFYNDGARYRWLTYVELY